MFARVSTIMGTPQTVEDGIRNYKEQVIPTIKKEDGFSGAYFMVDRRSGKVMSITLWDTEQALQASSATGSRLRAQASEVAAASEPPLVEILEVAAHRS